MSVTFELPPTPTEEKREHETVGSPSVDILAQEIPDSIMVGLMDRSTEMKELSLRNELYFQSLKHYLEDKWPIFEEILYSERSKLADGEWIKQISSMLENNPPLWESFRELVGYIEEDDIYEEEEEEKDIVEI